MTDRKVPYTEYQLSAGIPTQGGGGGGPKLAATQIIKNIAPVNGNSASGTMAGFGSVLSVTPLGTGIINVTIASGSQAAPAAGAPTFGGYYGTGAAPANGDAVSGNPGGNTTSPYSPTNGVAAFSIIMLMTVAVGVSIWIDVAIYGDGSNTFALYDTTAIIEELPA